MRLVRFDMRSTLAYCLMVSLVLSIALSSFTMTQSHLPGQQAAAEKVKHAESAMKVHEHGHSHHDGEDHERNEGHVHGHNPADHSHEKPYVVFIALPTRAVTPNSHDIDAGNEPKADTIGCLERPPKAIFLT